MQASKALQQLVCLFESLFSLYLINGLDRKANQPSDLFVWEVRLKLSQLSA